MITKHNNKSIYRYMLMLPGKLQVQVRRTAKGGFWAKVVGFPGCYTQAKDFEELMEMVNDAVFTYLDIPGKFRNSLGRYIPENLKKKIDEQAKHKHVETVYQKAIEGLKAKETLSFIRG